MTRCVNVACVGRKAAAPRERLIRRYGNRKLYDPSARRYVTMADLARMVGRGEDVRVEDQRTGEDLTTIVLAQVVLKDLKQRTARIPREVLARLIQLGRGRGAAGLWDAPREAAARARDEAERIVSGLLSRGRLSLDEALALRQEIANSVQRLVGEAQRRLESRVHALIEKTEGEGAPASLQALKHKLLVFEGYLGKPVRRRRR
jgi:polyhydroxyalkanoate synthesis repressor PhaR